LENLEQNGKIWKNYVKFGKFLKIRKKGKIGIFFKGILGDFERI